MKPGWRRVKFGDVVRLNTDSSRDPAADGLERYVGLEHVEPGDLRIRSWGDIADGITFTNRFGPGQVLFGKRRAYQRKVAVADFDGVCSGDIYVFEPKDPGELLPELLPFICQTDAFFDYAVGTSAGSLSPRTNWKSLAAYELALPPLEEQRRIARVLQASQRMLAELKNAHRSSQAQAASWINERLAFFDERAHHKLAKTLVTRLTVGIVVKPAALYVESGNGVLALRSLNVFPGRFDLSETVEISMEGHAAHCKSALSTGDVVIVRTGRPGDAAMVSPELDGSNCIDLIVLSVCDELDARYLVTFLNSAYGRRLFSAGTTGSAQKHFNVGAFSKIAIPLPRKEEQRVFVEQLEEFDAQELAIRTRIRQAEMVSLGLADRALHG